MARNPHRQGGLATPPPELDDDSSDSPTFNQDEPEHDDAGNGSADDATTRDRPGRGARLPSVSPRASSIAGDGAGWVLGLVLWGWVILPFVKGGPAQVKKVWMAKFLNKAPDGSWLP